MKISGIFSALKKFHESDNPVAKGLRGFGAGVASAPAGADVKERLAYGGGGAIRGIRQQPKEDGETDPITEKVPHAAPPVAGEIGPSDEIAVMKRKLARAIGGMG